MYAASGSVAWNPVSKTRSAGHWVQDTLGRLDGVQLDAVVSGANSHCRAMAAFTSGGCACWRENSAPCTMRCPAASISHAAGFQAAARRRLRRINGDRFLGGCTEGCGYATLPYPPAGPSRRDRPERLRRLGGGSPEAARTAALQAARSRVENEHTHAARSVDHVQSRISAYPRRAPRYTVLLQQLVAQELLEVTAGIAKTRHAVHYIASQVKAVEIVQHGHVERGGGGSLLFIPAHVQVFVIGAAVGEPVDQPGYRGREHNGTTV